jgi:hypothetical protein
MSRKKDGHDLRALCERRMEKAAGRCRLSEETLREYGLAPADLAEWCREAGFEAQPPLFPGGVYELRRRDK